MQSWFKNSWVFIGISVLFFGFLTGLLCLYPKAEVHLMLNCCHTAFGDTFFRWWTKIAEIAPYLCAFLLLFHRYADAIYVLLSELVSGLVIQIIKHFVNAPRPITYFAANKQLSQLSLVDGVDMKEWFSFPSGHTSSFFSLCFILTIVINQILIQKQPINKNGLLVLTQICFVFIALLGGYSRIYLSQHFALDVLVGGIIGLIIAIAFYFIYKRIINTDWGNKPLVLKRR